MPVNLTPSPTFSLGIHMFVLYVCVSFSLEIKLSIPFFYIPHMCVLIYDTCFSLSDLLHSV